MNKIESVQLMGTSNEITLEYKELRKMLLIARALEHDLRKKMIQLLTENTKMTVTEVYLKLKIEQSVASQHLAILRKAGIVANSRDGKFIFYSLNKNNLGRISNFLDQIN